MEKPNGAQVALVLLLLIACAQSSHAPQISFGSSSFSIELAKTQGEKEQGLMYRESMPSDSGMLFFFDDTEPRTFWMKNTKIALDMVSLDENLTVTGVSAGVPPCIADPCAVYPLAPARYILEVSAGQAEKSGIAPGARAQLRE